MNIDGSEGPFARKKISLEGNVTCYENNRSGVEHGDNNTKKETREASRHEHKEEVV